MMIQQMLIGLKFPCSVVTQRSELRILKSTAYKGSQFFFTLVCIFCTLW